MTEIDDTPVQLRAELEEARRRIQVLEVAAQALQVLNQELASAMETLSTPLIPISERVVVMPLIGILDEPRLRRVTEGLLAGLSDSGARVAILDVTGVPDVDSRAAAGIVAAARAAQLLGVEVLLTGISPDVARILVALNVDLGGIETRGTLQRGIAFAMEEARAGHAAAPPASPRPPASDASGRRRSP